MAQDGLLILGKLDGALHLVYYRRLEPWRQNGPTVGESRFTLNAAPANPMRIRTNSETQCPAIGGMGTIITPPDDVDFGSVRSIRAKTQSPS
jgi:hypothetical protein